MNENNTAISFFDERVRPWQNGKIEKHCTTGRIYKVYQGWYRENNNGFAKLSKQFRETLASYLEADYSDITTRGFMSARYATSDKEEHTMITYTERLPYTGSPEYDKCFWNTMRGKDDLYAELSKGSNTETGTYALPNTSNNKYMAALEKESLFRRIGTVIKAYGNGYRVFAKDTKDIARWVPEGESIPVYDGIGD
ncbi:MAG: phage major capsid protein, partial [Clostridia bacterium]|nr:phage major capsid protein [Clostridia bacterium]